MTAVLALFQGPIAGWSVVEFLILLVIICGCIALAYIGLGQLGITIPPWVIQVGKVVCVVVVIIFAIKIIASLL
jgi:hypothetical protein